MIDIAIVRKLADTLELPLGMILSKNGKHNLDADLHKYNRAAQFSPWFVLRDLDQDADCAPGLIKKLLVSPHPHLCFRIPVRASETWLLADHRHLAKFLDISASILPRQPELLDHPKVFLINLARRSRKAQISDMVPEVGVSSIVGPGYTGHMTDFVAHLWQPLEAAKRADSLARCIRSLKYLVW